MWSLTEFNLIVVGNMRDDPIFAQESGRCSFPRQRLFEFTDQNLQDRYRGDFANLGNLPAIVTTELYANEVMPAFLCLISEVKEQGADISFRFQKLSDQITANEIFGSGLFDITIRNYGIDESSRTHWAVKEGNAVEGVFKLIENRLENQRPKIFNVREWPVPAENRVAVMMPFRDELNSVYEAIKSACSSQRLQARRVDDISSPTPIADDVFKTIAESKFVVCDLTGHNPNVMYETGLAHGLNQDVIMIVQDDDGGGVPFDIGHIRHIQYKNDEDGLKRLAEILSRFIRDGLDAQRR